MYGETSATSGILRERCQQQLFRREVLPDRAGPGPGATAVVLLVPPVDHGVERCERVDFGNGDEVVAAEPAGLALGSAFLVGAADAGLAVEGLQPEPPRVREN